MLDIPPSSCTLDSHIYAATVANRVLSAGSAHTPSHFLLNLSLIPHIEKPNLTSLSWPSQHQTSFGSSDVVGLRSILREVGSRSILTPSGSRTFIIVETVRLVESV